MTVEELTKQWFEEILGTPHDDERINDIKGEPRKIIVKQDGKEYELINGKFVEVNCPF